VKPRIATLALLLTGCTLAGGAYAQTDGAPMTHSQKKAYKAQKKADKRSDVAQAKADKKKTEVQGNANDKKADANLDAAKKE
jgi:hypothetical protein